MNILIIIELGIAVALVAFLVIKSKFGKKVITKSTGDVAVSKENDKDRESTIKHIEEHQEDIKATVKEADKVSEEHTDNLEERRVEADARRKELNEKTN